MSEEEKVIIPRKLSNKGSKKESTTETKKEPTVKAKNGRKVKRERTEEELMLEKERITKQKKINNKKRYRTAFRLSSKKLDEFFNGKPVTDLAKKKMENNITMVFEAVYNCSDDFRTNILKLKEPNEASLNFALEILLNK